MMCTRSLPVKVSAVSHLRSAFFISLFVLVGLSSHAQNTMVLEGVVIDQNDQTISFANVYVDGENLGTVTNDQGEFIIKIPSTLRSSVLKISFIGYVTQQFDIEKIEKPITIQLTQDAFVLDAVEITPYNALKIIQQAIAKIPQNHYSVPLKQEGFYRGLTYFEDSLVQLEETAVNMFKRPEASIENDKVTLLKRRFTQDQQAFQQLESKMNGEIIFGSNIQSFLRLDFVKNQDDFHLFSKRSMKNHAFSVDDIQSNYDGAVYVISFEPLKKGWLKGELYIDTASLAFSGLNYQFVDLGYAKNRIIDVPTKIAFHLLKIFTEINSYETSVRYVPINGQWYLQTGVIAMDIELTKTRKSPSRFVYSDTYHISSHFETTDEDIDNAQNTIEKQYYLHRKDEKDDDFWKEYNIIKQSTLYQNEFERIRAKNETFVSDDELENK